MTRYVWTEATRDAIDAVAVTSSPDNGATTTPDLVVLAMTASGPEGHRDPMRTEAERHLTPTAARVLAAYLIDAADLIERGPDPRKALDAVRAILWPPEDPERQWSPDDLSDIAALVGRPPA